MVLGLPLEYEIKKEKTEKYKNDTIYLVTGNRLNSKKHKGENRLIVHVMRGHWFSLCVGS